MNQPNNQRYQDTERRIHAALMSFLERDGANLPTVLEICQAAQINRSTFYRHYQDVYDLMRQTERDIQRGLLRELSSGPRTLLEGYGINELTAMLRYISRYRGFYQVYLKEHSLDSMAAGFQVFFKNKIKPMFQAVGVQNEVRMDYYYRFIRAGFLCVVSIWLENGCQEPPEEIAEILRNVLARPID